MRRSTPLRPSRGTTWPHEVRGHVRSHYAGCLGPLVGMPGLCLGAVELDHVRASHGMGMKSESIATNAAPLCGWHHDLKTRDGRTWRPALLTVIGALTRDCESCQSEIHESHVDPCPECPRRAVAV